MKLVTENFVVLMQGEVKKDFLRSSLPSPEILVQPNGVSSFRPASCNDIMRHGVPIGLPPYIFYPRSDWERAGILGRLFGIRKQVRRKLRMVLLIDTFGGRMRGVENLIETSQRVREKGGSVIAIGGHGIGSAGAMAFMAADHGQRYLLPSSELFFHEFRVDISGTDRDAIPDDIKDGVMREIADKSWGRVKELLLENTSGSRRRPMQVALECLESAEAISLFGERQVYMRGHFAEGAGLATVTDSLREKFEQVCCVKRKAYENTAIEDFFMRQESRVV